MRARAPLRHTMVSTGKTQADAPISQLATLASREWVAPDLQLLRFRLAKPIAARAGQFAMIRGMRLDEGPLLPRPMSLLSAGSEPTMLVRRVGRGTAKLATAALGEGFQLLAPLGTPWRPVEPGTTPVLVAGGVGLPPLLFFATEHAERASPLHRDARTSSRQTERPILLYGGRSAADIVLADAIERVAELRIATDDGSRGHAGLVTDLLAATLDEIARAGGRACVLACGPQPMMAAAAAMAAERRVGCQVSLEARMACGYGVCLGCAVRRSHGGYAYVCSDGPCLEATDVDWGAAR